MKKILLVTTLLLVCPLVAMAHPFDFDSDHEGWLLQYDRKEYTVIGGVPSEFYNMAVPGVSLSWNAAGQWLDLHADFDGYWTGDDDNRFDSIAPQSEDWFAHNGQANFWGRLNPDYTGSDPEGHYPLSEQWQCKCLYILDIFNPFTGGDDDRVMANMFVKGWDFGETWEWTFVQNTWVDLQPGWNRLTLTKAEIIAGGVNPCELREIGVQIGSPCDIETADVAFHIDNVQAIPEPSTVIMLIGGGLLGLTGIVRKRLSR